MKYKLIFLLLIFSILSSCNLLPFVKYYTTTKDGKFPKFSKMEYLAGTNNKYRSSYDISFYNLNIEVFPKKKFIEGSMVINFEVKQKTDTILIDLHKNLKLDSIKLDDMSELSWKRKGDLVFLIFNHILEIGNTKKIEIFYRGNPPKLLNYGPIHWKKDKNGKFWISTSTQGIGAHWIMPCKYLLNDEPDSIRMNITVPKGLIAVCNGRLKNRKTINNKESFEWITKNPINVYNISFNIGDFKHFEIPYANSSGNHQLQFWVLPYHYDKAKEYLKQCVDILHFYESIYDEYPWWNDEFKIIESSYPIGSGMEHQSAITVGLSYENNLFDYSALLVHEIAHEWWGNSVSIEDYGDIWMHEGFAEFNELLFTEYKYGKYQYNQMSKIYKNYIYNKRQLIKPLNVLYNPFVNSIDSDVYYKGALVLYTLRYCIDNDSLFFDILKSFYLKYKKKNIRTIDFINHVNNKTNRNFNWFFNQYLYNYKIPELHYFEKDELSDSGKISTFYYKWMNTEAEFKMPVNIIADDDTISLIPSVELKSIKFTNIDTLYFDENNGYFDMLKDISINNFVKK